MKNLSMLNCLVVGDDGVPIPPHDLYVMVDEKKLSGKNKKIAKDYLESLGFSPCSMKVGDISFRRETNTVHCVEFSVPLREVDTNLDFIEDSQGEKTQLLTEKDKAFLRMLQQFYIPTK